MAERASKDVNGENEVWAGEGDDIGEVLGDQQRDLAAYSVEAMGQAGGGRAAGADPSNAGEQPGGELAVASPLACNSLPHRQCGVWNRCPGLDRQRGAESRERTPAKLAGVVTVILRERDRSLPNASLKTDRPIL